MMIVEAVKGLYHLNRLNGSSRLGAAARSVVTAVAYPTAGRLNSYLDRKATDKTWQNATAWQYGQFVVTTMTLQKAPPYDAVAEKRNEILQIRYKELKHQEAQRYGTAAGFQANSLRDYDANGKYASKPIEANTGLLAWIRDWLLNK